jgi:hypothetical protein
MSESSANSPHKAVSGFVLSTEPLWDGTIPPPFVLSTEPLWDGTIQPPLDGEQEDEPDNSP